MRKSRSREQLPFIRGYHCDISAICNHPDFHLGDTVFWAVSPTSKWRRWAQYDVSGMQLVQGSQSRDQGINCRIGAHAKLAHGRARPWRSAGLTATLETMSEKVRRLSALCLALAFSVGLMAHGVQTSDMTVKMTAAAASDMPMPSGCSDCDGDHGVTAACFALCGGLLAVLPLVPTVVAAVSLSTPAVQGIPVAGHYGPPDPYPPRPTILG